MIMVYVSKCPEKLRGDLTKWLYPVGTGIYVGSVNARVREYIWSRALEYVSAGSVVMVYDCKTEAGIEIRSHGTGFTAKDYDGLALPFVAVEPVVGNDGLPTGVPIKAVSWRMRKRRLKQAVSDVKAKRLAFVDIETTGLDRMKDDIIEIAVLRVDGNVITGEWSSLVACDRLVPAKVRDLTGITDEMLSEQGIGLREALDVFHDLISGCEVLCYNEGFDIVFLDRELVKTGMLTIGGMCGIHDVMKDVKKYFNGRDRPGSYKLMDVAKWFGLDVTGMHRALQDCYVLYQVWARVNENRDSV